MLPAPIQNHWLRLSLLVAFVVAALVTLTPSRVVLAGDPAESIVVSSDGEETTAESTRSRWSLPFRGTGMLNEKTALIPPVNGMIFDERTESIIGLDNRTKVTDTTTYPNSAIASLVHTFNGVDNFVCTGWFIGPNILATAGHCVYDPFDEEKFATAMVVYPGRNGNVAPFGVANATKLFTTKCWKDTGKPNCDYGAVRINSNLGNTVGWFGFGWYEDGGQLFDHKANVRGYPGVPPDGTPYGSSWTHRGRIQQVEKKQLGYSIDTTGGQSGAPIFAKFDFGNNVICNPCGVGIHTNGVADPPLPPFYNRNSGTRITEKVFNKFCNWRGGC